MTRTSQMKMPKASEVFADENRSDKEQQALEERFFRMLRMPNGTYKTTKPSRLTEFDDVIATCLSKSKALRVLDVGVASGATTVDLTRKLSTLADAVEVVAVDLYLWGELAVISQRWEALYSSAGDILQLCIGPTTRPRPQSNSVLKNSTLMFGLNILGWIARKIQPATQRIPLVTANLRNNPQIELVEHDVERFRHEWTSSFDVVRAANLLNRSYFPEAKLTRMIKNLANYLTPAGVLAVCRSDDETGMHHGNVFRRSANHGRFDEIERLGDGSEVRDIILRLE